MTDRILNNPNAAPVSAEAKMPLNHMFHTAVEKEFYSRIKAAETEIQELKQQLAEQENLKEHYERVLDDTESELLRLSQVNGELVEALKQVAALFVHPQPFYIKKLGAPITNGDQAMIDAAFMAAEAALAEAQKK